MSTPAPNTQTAIAKQEKEMVFVPFGSQDEIKLSIAIVRNMVAVPSRSNQLPADRDCMRFMMLCKARKLNPFEGDCWLLGFDTKDGTKFEMITAHAALVKRAEVHPDYNGMESGIIVAPPTECPMCKAMGYLQVASDFKQCPRCHGSGTADEIKGSCLPKDITLMGGWARLHFKGKAVPTYDRIPLKGYAKSFGRWLEDAPGQIQKCAEASVLRLAFPNTLGGLYLKEEIAVEAEPKSQAAPPVFDMPQLANGTKPVSAPRVDDPLPESEAPQEHPLETPQMPRPASEGKSPGEVIDALTGLLRDNNLHEDALTAWARASKRAKPNQHWNELADSKLRTILDEWETLLPMIKEVEV